VKKSTQQHLFKTLGTAWAFLLAAAVLITVHDTGADTLAGHGTTCIAAALAGFVTVRATRAWAPRLAIVPALVLLAFAVCMALAGWTHATPGYERWGEWDIGWRLLVEAGISAGIGAFSPWLPRIWVNIIAERELPA